MEQPLPPGGPMGAIDMPPMGQVMGGDAFPQHPPLTSPNDESLHNGDYQRKFQNFF